MQMSRMLERVRTVLWLLAVAAIVGCSSTSLHGDRQLHTERDVALSPGEPQVERGRPAPVVDAVGWVVGVPAKIIMLDHRVSNHHVSPETEMAMQTYLAQNGLDKVKVRVNEYDPLGEWQRLRDNKSVSWPVRYSIGALSVVGYSVFPGRIFGGDHYNPYTNSVYLYSDVPAMAVYQGSYARDFAMKEDRDFYAVGYALPGINMWHSSQAACDALDYLGTRESSNDLRDGYQTICPACACQVAPLGSIANVPIVLPAIAVGHAVGQVKAAEVTPPPAGQVTQQIPAALSRSQPDTAGATDVTLTSLQGADTRARSR